jgi:hypothetical protein
MYRVRGNLHFLIPAAGVWHRLGLPFLAPLGTAIPDLYSRQNCTKSWHFLTESGKIKVRLI